MAQRIDSWALAGLSVDPSVKPTLRRARPAHRAIDPGGDDTIAVTGGGDLTMDPGMYVVTRRLTSLPVLDVACGTGAVLVQAAGLVGPTGLAVGVDLAEPMVAVAARQLRRLGQGRGAVAVMDAERLGLRAGWFDAVCCASAIYLLGDQATAVRGWMQLLRPGGTLAISEFGDLDARWAWKDELRGRFGPPLEPLGAGHLAPQQLRQLLRLAGGGRVQVEVERLDVVYVDAQAWWAQQWAHGERRPLEQMNPRTLATYRAAAFAAIEACREADGVLHWRPEAIYATASM